MAEPDGQAVELVDPVVPALLGGTVEDFTAFRTSGSLTIPTAAGLRRAGSNGSKG